MGITLERALASVAGIQEEAAAKIDTALRAAIHRLAKQTLLT
jgi:hypothetical protein